MEIPQENNTLDSKNLVPKTWNRLEEFFGFTRISRPRDKHVGKIDVEPRATQETVLVPAYIAPNETTVLTTDEKLMPEEIKKSNEYSELQVVLNSPYVSEKSKKRLQILKHSIDDESMPKETAKLHTEAFNKLLEACKIEREEKRKKFSGAATKPKENKDGSPRKNEDAVFNDGNVLLIADGTDGSSTLSELLRDETVSHMKDKKWKSEQDPKVVEQELNELLKVLQEQSTNLSHEKIVNSTYTLVRKFTHNGDEYVGVIHIGDSRAYSHGRNGEITQLTQDDGILQNLKSESARALYTSFDLEVLDSLTKDQVDDVQKMIDTCKGLPIDGDVNRRDFMEFEGDIPAYLRTVEMFRKLRSSLSKSLSNGELSNKAAVFYKKLENCDGVFVTSDGIHDVLKPEELQFEVNAAVAESRADGTKISNIVIDVTEDTRSELAQANAFAKNDDKSFGWLASESEMNAQEFSAARENITGIGDLESRLNAFPIKEFAGSHGEIIKLDELITKIKTFSRQIDTYVAQNVLFDPSANGDAHVNSGSLRDFFPLYSVFREKNVNDFLKKQGFPLGYGILETTARVLTKKFEET